MPRTNPNDLIAFIAVARERSFTRAAAQLGVSPSALSHTMRGLEDRLGLRLLNRTTRSVSPTEAGERLLQSVGPRFDEIEAEVASLSSLRDTPAGTIRITAGEHAISTVLWPALRKFLPSYPDINIEIESDAGFTDIVAQRFDAGVRFGGTVAKDMIAVPISPDMRMVAVAAPSYLDDHDMPSTPHDLAQHKCINLRLPTHGGLYAWEFDHDGGEIRVRVEGQLTFSNLTPIVQSALDGFGFAFLPQTQVEQYLESGDLVEVLSQWTLPFSGYHLYYPSRRQPTPAFSLLVEALRYRA